ncbi:MAG: hypothetical protein HN975_06050 [Anaerolineae bacterium]|jgi:hypothetical protein|nr:hypothetical protein [Anaerolineae bacterium]MBT7070437.1 hypothetical protein [Anaerolineae bacterium]MBT7990628.1 hypothetical protein [Anaerolineae bacterium]
MREPNFIIAGAPRCGTTALYAYLSEHPDIFMSHVKELHYFSGDFPNMQKIAFHSHDDYLALFANATDAHLGIGEASTFYLFSEVAFQKMYAALPNAKVIISLRNPVDFVHSYHRLNLSLLRDNEADLAKAWALQEQRKLGKSLPPNFRESELLMYSELGKFSPYLQKLFAIYPHEQIKVILLDDLIENTKAVYEELLAFLDISSDGRCEFPQVNANFENKSQLMAKIFHPSPSVYRFFMKTISLFGTSFMERVSVFYNKAERLNTMPKKRTELDPEFRAYLISYFREDIEKISHLLNRDLSTWLE